MGYSEYQTLPDASYTLTVADQHGTNVFGYDHMGFAYDSFFDYGSSPTVESQTAASECAFNWARHTANRQTNSSAWTGVCPTLPSTTTVDAGSSGFSIGGPFVALDFNDVFTWSSYFGGCSLDLTFTQDPTQMNQFGNSVSVVLPAGAAFYELEAAPTTYLRTDIEIAYGSIPIGAALARPVTQIEWYWQLPRHVSDPPDYGPCLDSYLIDGSGGGNPGDRWTKKMWRNSTDPNAIGNNGANLLGTHSTTSDMATVTIPETAVTDGIAAKAALLTGPMAGVVDSPSNTASVPSLHILGILTMLREGTFPGLYDVSQSDAALGRTVYGGFYLPHVVLWFTPPRVRFFYPDVIDPPAIPNLTGLLDDNRASFSLGSS